MARRKLEKFADLHSYPNVYEYGYAELSSPEVAGQVAGSWGERAFDEDRPPVSYTHLNSPFGSRNILPIWSHSVL